MTVPTVDRFRAVPVATHPVMGLPLHKLRPRLAVGLQGAQQTGLRPSLASLLLETVKDIKVRQDEETCARSCLSWYMS